jgi:hypothetical protein
MALIEKLGSFYLGKEYDLANRKLLDAQVNYDARDLTTHAVCVGMTGSGKTGLCIDLLEEAALDGVPALLIDPKGDITNLLLTFPDLLPEDFLPWVNPDDARRKGLTPEDFAAAQAKQWRDGLASWDEGSDRIRALKAAADFAIYTPGSEAGLPVSIISSFNMPANLDWDTEGEALRERIQGTVSALLGMAGVEADPVRSREHILLSTLLENAWRKGEPMDLAKLIMGVQKPPFQQVGVLNLEAFYPEKDRFELAMALNNIIASPSFAAWLKGDPLDMPTLLYTPEGKPRHSIFYIAHLSDAERMFFVTILLESFISWMRSQPGTTSLRALVYMDEVFGYFPPSANPPSKRPMLTLLKQARAFGCGIVLTTQNPVDLDYKGLTNAGTWFIGKLQAERDKARLLDGLEGVMSDAGSLSDVKVLDKTISSLESRAFLMHNVNQSGPVVFQTRWAMSYLRGPLTRQQVKQLMADRKPAAAPAAARKPVVAGAAAAPPAASAAAAATSVAASRPAPQPNVQAGLASAPPVAPPGVNQVFLPVSVREGDAVRAVQSKAGAGIKPTAQQLVCEPSLVGLASVSFVDRKTGLNESNDVAMVLPIDPQATVIDWRNSEPISLTERDLATDPPEGALFAGGVPSSISAAHALTKLEGDLADHLYRTQAFTLLTNPTLKLFAKPGENERDFHARCQQAAREARDKAVDDVRSKYETKLDRLTEQKDREEEELASDKAQLQGRVGEEILTGLDTVAGMFGLFGTRRRGSLSGVSRVASKQRMQSRARASVQESEDAIKRLETDLAELKSQMEAEMSATTDVWTKAAEDIQEVKVAPRKTDIDVHLVTLAWMPTWEVTYQDARGLARTEAVPAFNA